MGLFQKASKQQGKLRLAIDGPSGSGKTYSSLAIATNLGKKVAVIDTEHGSASKYADLFNFDTLALGSFSPEEYIKGIQAACSEGYDVLVIDSLSHAWFGIGGILDIHTAKEKQQKNPNSWTAWKDVTPLQNKLVEAILSSDTHIIVTLRVKTKHEQVFENGKQVIKKLGLDPIQKEGMEYEFDVYGSMNLANELVIVKTRCTALNDKVFEKPGKEVADILSHWLGSGEAPTPRLVHVEENGKYDNHDAWANFKRVREELGVNEEEAREFIEDRIPPGQKMSEVPATRVMILIGEIRKKYEGVKA